tara:strand:+ start:16247 stop:17284 length:1038 start_codon:yes stop_codon:yes gene_type:complete
MNIFWTWRQLPQYGANLLSKMFNDKNNRYEVITSKSYLPIEGLEDTLGSPIKFVDENKKITWQELGLPVPDIFFQAGWYIRAFTSLGDQVRKNGGKIVLFADNSYKNSLRQKFGVIYFKFFLRNKFDCVWVTGRSGQILMKKAGFLGNKIYTGLYGSNDKIFKKGESLEKRNNQIIYCGQFIKRKGFKELIAAFKSYYINNDTWKLVVIGTGPLKNLAKGIDGIKCIDFKSPFVVSEYLRSSKYLILPSYEDHWPLIVNEACLSGCGILISDKVGNRHEFFNQNGYVFKSHSASEIKNVFNKINRLDKDKEKKISEKSYKLGKKFTQDTWNIKFKMIVDDLSKTI